MSKKANYCFLNCFISTNIFQTKVIKWNISQKFSRSLVITHSQFLKFILEFRMIDITCRWWSLVVIVGKWPRVAWLSCSFATGYTADLFSWNWKRKQVKIGKVLLFELRYLYWCFSHQRYRNGISQKFSRSLLISHSQFFRFILEFKMMDIICGWWSLVVIVGKWPRFAWLSCSFATGNTADLFSWDWKRKWVKIGNYCFLNCVISTNVFQTKVIKWNISQKFSRSLVISHSQFLKFILEFRMMDITCRWWSLAVIVGKWPRVAWLSCSFATGYNADLFSRDWKRK